MQRNNYVGVYRGATGGEAQGGAPPPAFDTLAKNISRNRGATHFNTWAKAKYYLILPIINIPAPPLEINQLRP